MSDEKLRKLERKADQGDPDALYRLRVERRRRRLCIVCGGGTEAYFCELCSQAFLNNPNDLTPAEIKAFRKLLKRV